MSQFEEIPSPGCGFQGSRVLGNPALAACNVDVTVLGLVGGAPAQGWGGDTARRRFIGGGRGPLLS